MNPTLPVKHTLTAGGGSGSPVADVMALIVSELAANAVLHSASAGEVFSVRAELHSDYGWVECEDYGGPWRIQAAGHRPHGLAIVEALTGPDNWGVEELLGFGRVVWARIDFQG